MMNAFPLPLLLNSGRKLGNPPFIVFPSEECPPPPTRRLQNFSQFFGIRNQLYGILLPLASHSVKFHVLSLFCVPFFQQLKDMEFSVKFADNKKEGKAYLVNRRYSHTLFPNQEIQEE